MAHKENTSNKKRVGAFVAWIGCSAMAALLLLAQGVYDPSALLFFFALILGVLVFRKMSFRVSYLIIASMLARTYYAYYLYSNGIVLFPDTYGYFQTVRAMLQADSLSFLTVVTYSGTLHVGYYYVAYLALRIFKTDLALYLLNIFLFFLSTLILSDYLEQEFGKGMAKAITVFINLSPFMFLFTSDVLKDSLVLFLAVSSLWAYRRYQCTHWRRYIVSMLMFLSLLTLTRIYSGVGLAVGIMVDFLANRDTKVETRKVLLLFGAMTIVFLFSPLRPLVDLGIFFITQIALSVATVTTLLKATISFLFSPLFWNMTYEVTKYTPLVLDSALLLVFSPLLLNFFVGFIRNKEVRKRTYIYVLPMLFHILALGITFETGGDRQKIAVYPFIVLFYLLGLRAAFRQSKAGHE